MRIVIVQVYHYHILSNYNAMHLRQGLALKLECKIYTSMSAATYYDCTLALYLK